MTAPKHQPAHPLFPAEGDEPPARIEEIHVARDTADGRKQEFHVRRFRADELTSLEQIVSAFGGGSYELYGYAGGRISRRKRYWFDGKRKPMNADSFADEEPDELEKLRAEFAATRGAPSGGGGLDMQTLFLLLKLMSDQQAASQQALSQVMVAALSNRPETPKDSTADVLRVVQQSNAAQFELLSRMVASGNQNPTGTMLDMVRHGIELGRQTAGGEEDEGDVVERIIGALSEAAGNMTAGFRAAAEADAARGAAEQPDPAPPNEAAGPATQEPPE